MGREAADHDAVVVVDLPRHALPAELLGTSHAGPAHLGPELVVAKEAAHGGGDLLRLARRDQERLPPAADDALVAVDVGGDDRRAGGHRLEEDDAERFAARRRRHVDVGRPEELRLLLVADPPEELDTLEAARRDVAACLAAERPGTDDEQAAVAAGLAQDAIGLEQLEQTLARLMAADEQQVASSRPATARSGRPAGIRVTSTPFGNDLVVAGEVAVDEVLGRAADRDPAVEAGGLALHHLAAELVRRREPAVGMEGGDVHARREPQEDRRQERHERLMEVEQVELLALEASRGPGTRTAARA